MSKITIEFFHDVICSTRSTSVPTLTINGKHPLVGALPLPRVMSSIQKVME